MFKTLALLLLLLFVLIGCGPAQAMPALDVPLDVGDPGILTPGVPAYFEFNGVRTNVVIDSWTSDGFVQIGKASIEYKQGYPLAVYVYNGYDVPTSFAVSYQDISGEQAYSLATNKTYSRAPAAAWQWLSIKYPHPKVAPKSVRVVPFSLTIPNDVTLPDAWEFRINIQPEDVGTLVTGASIRVLVSK